MAAEPTDEQRRITTVEPPTSNVWMSILLTLVGLLVVLLVLFFSMT